MDKNECIQEIQAGNVIAMPTDTVWGLLGLVSNAETVEEIYRLKQRDPSKSCIGLIDSIERLKEFDIELTENQQKYVEDVWPGPVSVIFDLPQQVRGKYWYLHRGNESLAFRVPDQQWLRDVLAQTGPLVAPSANIEGQPVATSPEEVREYFGENVGIYVPDDYTSSGRSASKLVRLDQGGEVEMLRD